MYVVKSLAVAFGFAAAVSVATYEYKQRTNSRSLLYLGQDKSFEQQLDQEFGVPVSQMIPYVTKFHFSSLLQLAGDRSDSAVRAALLEPADELRARYPHSFLGELLAFYAARQLGDAALARTHLEQAHRVADANPDWTRPLAHLLPPRERLAAPAWQAVWSELLPDRLWTVSTPLLSDGQSWSASAHDPEEVVTSVVRTRAGHVLLVNPGVFDAATVAAIDRLGSVGAVFFHSSGQESTRHVVDFVRQTWPSAALVGLEQQQQQQQQQQLDSDEFVVVPVAGYWGYQALLHPDTATLFGLPAVSTRRSRNVGDYAALIDFAMGQHRGPFATPLDPPSYMWLVLSSPLDFRTGVLALLDQPWDRVVPGQGETLPQGKQARRHIMQAYNWLLCPQGIDYSLSKLDQFYMQIAWASQHRLIPIFWQVMKAMMSRIFNQDKRPSSRFE